MKVFQEHKSKEIWLKRTSLKPTSDKPADLNLLSKNSTTPSPTKI
jgi:hypothetical protein